MKPQDEDRRPWWNDIPKLWQRDIKSAMRVRWDSGRIGHGRKETDPFVGDPLEEMYEELIDALNYAKEMPFEEGDWQRLWNLTEKIRQQLCYRDREKEEPTYLGEEQRMGFEPFQSEEEFLSNPFMSAQCFTQPSSIAGPGPSTQHSQNISSELQELQKIASDLLTLQARLEVLSLTLHHKTLGNGRNS